MKIDDPDYLEFLDWYFDETPEGTKFETLKEDADDLVYITTNFGYSFGIPRADFEAAIKDYEEFKSGDS